MKIHIIFHIPDDVEMVQFSPAVPNHDDIVWLNDNVYRVIDYPEWVFKKNELSEVHIYLAHS